MIDYDGVHVIDGNGENIGTVERTYADGAGMVQFVEVKIGGLFAKHRMVPVEDPTLENGSLRVAHTKPVILSSPDVSNIDHAFDGDVLAAVRDFYDGAPVADSQDKGAEAETKTEAETVEDPVSGRA